MEKHWTLESIKEKLDPAEYRMFETWARIEGKKEVVRYIGKTIATMHDAEFKTLNRHLFLYGLEEVVLEIQKKYSHLFEKEPANVE